MTGEVKRYTKADEKLAFKLYKEYVTGRGYVWSPECTLSEDVQGAILAAIVSTRADHLAVVEGLRARVVEMEDANAWRVQNWTQALDNMQARLKVAETDAKRYRRLRTLDAAMCDITSVWGASGDAEYLDAAIDEAMRGGDGRG